MTDKRESVIREFDGRNVEEVTAAVRRQIDHLVNTDAGNIEGLVIAVKLRNDGGKPNFQMSSVGSPYLLVGIIKDAVEQLEQNVPGMKEILDGMEDDDPV